MKRIIYWARLKRLFAGTATKWRKHELAILREGGISALTPQPKEVRIRARPHTWLWADKFASRDLHPAIEHDGRTR